MVKRTNFVYSFEGANFKRLTINHNHFHLFLIDNQNQKTWGLQAKLPI
jgi:hypothetical protein